MLNRVHLIMIPFRGVGVDLRDDEWFAQRIAVFKEYTLNSLLNQTERNFVLWLTFRPEDENTYLVLQLSHYLKSLDIPFVFTFNGLMYWDDKFGKGTKLRNVGRIIRYCWRNSTWGELLPSLWALREDKNKTLERRIERSLRKLHPYFWEASTIYLTRIDSDDMFHQDAVKNIQTMVLPYDEGTAIVCDKGYIFNTSTNEVAEYVPETNPPFHTLVFTASDFFNADKHVAHYRGYKSHEDIRDLFYCQTLPNGMYCVVIHTPKNHISTTWTHPFKGDLVDPGVMMNFGVALFSFYLKK